MEADDSSSYAAIVVNKMNTPSGPVWTVRVSLQAVADLAAAIEMGRTIGRMEGAKKFEEIHRDNSNKEE